jgi:hypothetical protein
MHFLHAASVSSEHFRLKQATVSALSQWDLLSTVAGDTLDEHLCLTAWQFCAQTMLYGHSCRQPPDRHCVEIRTCALLTTPSKYLMCPRQSQPSCRLLATKPMPVGGKGQYTQQRGHGKRWLRYSVTSLGILVHVHAFAAAAAFRIAIPHTAVLLVLMPRHWQRPTPSTLMLTTVPQTPVSPKSIHQPRHVSARTHRSLPRQRHTCGCRGSCSTTNRQQQGHIYGLLVCTRASGLQAQGQTSHTHNKPEFMTQILTTDKHPNLNQLSQHWQHSQIRIPPPPYSTVSEF